MFSLLHVLFLLLGIPAIIAYKSVGCPILEKKDIVKKCSARVEHICLDDSSCPTESRCCPTSVDGGCSLMCVKPRTLEGCPIPLDFAMIVDTSGSIRRRDFKKLRDFVEDMVDGFDISEKGTHIAVIEYSTNASVQLRFNDFSGAQLNAANVKRRIRTIPHARGSTYIDKALKLADSEVFSEKGGMRPNVTKVALVMTDGKQTLDDEDTLSSDILNAAVQPLKDKKVRILSLGIGGAANLFDLLTIASTDSDMYLAENFEQLKDLVTDLTQNKCPVHGNWSTWSPFGACSVTCGRGVQARFRACDNPPPAYGGRDCVGESEDIRPCNDIPCEVDGNWAEWKPWGICPVTCGGGIQTRERTCTNPLPLNGGRACEGDGVQTLPCNEIPCPVDGRWTEWKAWSQCNVTCGGGTQSRSRTCTDPPPQHGGEDCSGENEEVRSCNNFPCPIDGKWTAWKAWEPCSVTCGGGVQMSRRSCTNPEPAFGGADCEGVSVRSRSCNERGCPVDGKWTAWKAWEPCSVTCGGGVQMSRRSCSNPAPAFGGADCGGISVRSRSCNERGCPVDANWSEWGPFSVCSVSCGGGTKNRSRTCTNPPPKFEGADCVGESQDIQSCNNFPCPMDGRWSQWGIWGSCSLTCGDGIQDRLRTCTNPPPAFGGKKCSGPDVETRFCQQLPCPVDGRWSAWDNWGTCSATCGGGIQNRSRSCTNPPPSFGGQECKGDKQRIRFCNEQPCSGFTVILLAYIN